MENIWDITGVRKLGVRMEKWIGKKACILLENKGKDFEKWNMDYSEISTEVLAVEEHVGIWVANNTLEFIFKIDKEGKSIPEQEQKSEKVNTKVLIPWRFIKGILVLDDERVRVIKSGTIGF